MTDMVTYMDVQDTTLGLVGPGATVGEHTVPADKVGLVITSTVTGDQVLVIGTPQQLRDSVVDGMCLPVPDGVALVDAEHPRAHGFVVVDGGDQLPADMPSFLDE